MKLKLLINGIIICTCPIAGFTDPLADAIAVSATSSMIATGSALYMRNNGVEPMIVNTNVGPVAIPAPYKSNQLNQPNYYEQQVDSNQQKMDFMSD